MSVSRADYAYPETNFAPYNAKDGGCSAHGRDRCDRPAEFILSGKVLYPACAGFLAEHPEIPVHENPNA